MAPCNLRVIVSDVLFKMCSLLEDCPPPKNKKIKKKPKLIDEQKFQKSTYNATDDGLISLLNKGSYVSTNKK